MNGQLHALVALYKEKELPYLLNRRLGGSQSQSRRFEEERNLWPVPAIEPLFLVCPSRSLVAVPTELYRSISCHEQAHSVKQCIKWSLPTVERSESEPRRRNFYRFAPRNRTFYREKFELLCNR